MRRLLTHSFLALTVLSTSPSVLADPAAAPQSQQSEYDTKYEAGLDAIKNQRWTEAKRIYLDLWKRQKTYEVALNLGLAELNLELYPEAAEHLAFGVNHIPPHEKPERVQRLRALLGVAKLEVGTLKIEVNQPDAEVLIDGKTLGTSPLKTAVYVSPGERRIEARLGDNVDQRTIVAKAGEEYAIDLKLEAGAAGGTAKSADSTRVSPGSPGPKYTPVPPPDQGALKSNLLPVYIAGGVGLVGLGVGIAATLDRSAKIERANELHGDLGVSDCFSNASRTCHDLQDANKAADRDSTLMVIGYSAAGAGAVAATVLWLLSDDGSMEDSTKSAHVLPSVGPGSAQVSVVGTF